jgi:hypothetical protein
VRTPRIAKTECSTTPTGQPAFGPLRIANAHPQPLRHPGCNGGSIRLAKIFSYFFPSRCSLVSEGSSRRIFPRPMGIARFRASQPMAQAKMRTFPFTSLWSCTRVSPPLTFSACQTPPAVVPISSCMATTQVQRGSLAEIICVDACGGFERKSLQQDWSRRDERTKLAVLRGHS